jgi:hypothetical protein
VRYEVASKASFNLQYTIQCLRIKNFPGIIKYNAGNGCFLHSNVRCGLQLQLISGM